MTQSFPPEQPNQPRMRPTSLATLCVAALAAAAVTWVLVSQFYYGYGLPLSWLPALTLAGLATVEALTAPATKARIDRKKGTSPVNPLVVARYVVLAKASSMAGALFSGVYAALTVYLLMEHGRTATNRDLPAAVVGLVGAVALVAAALWLEWACRVPPPPPDKTGTPPADDWADDERSGDDRSAGGRTGG